MIYELREYYAVPGRLPALNQRFEKITLGYFTKHGMRVVGFWTDEVGTSNKLTYMLAFEDMGERERAWTSFRADAERLKAFEETERDGPLVERIKNRFLRPTAYSPMP